jgi:hypothetical protein
MIIMTQYPIKPLASINSHHFYDNIFMLENTYNQQRLQHIHEGVHSRLAGIVG